MEEKVIERMEESIQRIMDEGVNTNNLEHLYKLSKIKHLAKEDKEMNNEYYGNYGGRRAGYDSYGRYGRRGYDMRYRGEEELDRISGEYDRYQENRSRYGANEETDKSFHYMVKALEDFIRVLHEEADTPQQKQMLNETLQRSMR